MANIHASFCKWMSFSLEQHGVVYGDFLRERGYRDFKLSLDEIETPLDIASVAIAELCNGSDSGSMDAAVVYAVTQFLCENATPNGTLSWKLLGSKLHSELPVERGRARQLVESHFQN